MGKNYKKEELKNCYPILIRIEKYQVSWLKKEAKKRKISLAGIIRNLIENLIDKKRATHN